jgi:hypothetical protein
MSKQQYYALIDQLCEATGIEGSPMMYEICNLQIKKTEFMIMHGREGDEDSIYMFADFGEPPAENKLEVLQQLMGTNLFMYGNNGPSFGYDKENGHVILASRLALSQSTLESFMKALEGIADTAAMWRMGMPLDGLAPARK